MKKYSLYTLVLIVISSINIYSQSPFVKFSMKKHIEYARQKAKETGLLEPKLLCALTSEREFEYFGTKFQLKYDLSTGKSDAWIYVFKEKNDSNVVHAELVVETVVTVLSLPVTQLQLDLPMMTKNVTLDDVNYEDSDVIIPIITQNIDFIDYYNQNQPFDQFNIIIANAAQVYNLIPNNPYWALAMEKNKIIKFCYAHAFTKEFACSSEYVSINDNNNSKINMYPNPSSDLINIDNFPDNEFFEIYDVYGSKIDNIPFQVNNNGLVLDIKNLTSGVYYLRTKQNYFMFVKR